MNRKICSMLIILLILFSLCSQVMARDNTALSVATAFDPNANTLNICNNSSQHYANAGYTSYIGCDLDANTLYSYLYADVQFFAAHGAEDNIKFEYSGICKGKTETIGNRTYIGTNDVHWDADTILVTYLACQCAKDSSWDTVAGATCNRGANTVVGFNNVIYIASAESWTDRYNAKLEQGSTVYDAASYANSFIYLYPSIKKLTIYGETNTTIGSSNRSLNNSKDVLSDSREIVYNKMLSKNNLKLDDVATYIESNLINNDLFNYEIVKTDGITITRNENEKYTGTNYIDIILKVGDFYTDRGYTIEENNGIVEKIYDNTLNIQEKINSINKSEFKNNIDNYEISILQHKAIKETEFKYKNSNLKIEYNETNTKLYYDIENNEKYVIVEVKSTIDDGTTKESVAYDTVLYKI